MVRWEPGGIHSKVGSHGPEGIHASVGRPGGIHASVGRPGGIHASMGRPGGIHASMGRPGGMCLPEGIHLKVEHLGLDDYLRCAKLTSRVLSGALWEDVG